MVQNNISKPELRKKSTSAVTFRLPVWENHLAGICHIAPQIIVMLDRTIPPPAHPLLIPSLQVPDKQILKNGIEISCFFDSA